MHSIFICYRSEDSKAAAPLLHLRLQRASRFWRVFYAHRVIDPGDKLDEELVRAARESTIMLVLIGHDWLHYRRPGENAESLQCENDWVRVEIRAAIKNGVRLIPVLLDGVQMPTAGELPPDIQSLALRGDVAIRTSKIDDYDNVARAVTKHLRLRSVGAVPRLAATLLLWLAVLALVNVPGLQLAGSETLADVAAVAGGAAVAIVPLQQWRTPPGVPRRPLHAPRSLLSAIVATFGVIGLVLLTVRGVAPGLLSTTDHASRCGTALVAVDHPDAVQPFLDLYQQAAAAGGGALSAEARTCAAAGSLHLTNTQDDVHARLLDPDSPVAAVITSDYRSLTGLDGDWRNLAHAPAEKPWWTVIGLDPAVVALPHDSDDGQRKSIALGELTGMTVRVPSLTNPVVLAVRQAAARLSVGSPSGSSRPLITEQSIATAQEMCAVSQGSALVLPRSGVPPCLPTSSRTAIPLTEEPANLVGAPVLGVPLTTGTATTGPTSATTAATEGFLRWLPSSGYLPSLTRTVPQALQQVREMKALADTTAHPPLHVSVVVDASLSMARSTTTRSASAPDQYGNAPPWRRLVDGLVLWAGGAALDPEDRLTLVAAQSSGGGPRAVDLDQARLPTVRAWLGAIRPGGETALARALRTVGTHEDQAGDRRRVRVLLTDGVNLFTEDPSLRSVSLEDWWVVVVGGTKGCSGLPAAIRSAGRCRPATTSASDVTLQLQTLLETTRKGRA